MKVFVEKQTMRLNGKRAVSGIVAVLFLLLLSALTSVNAYQLGETFRDCAACPEMVVLPAEKFIMGSPEDERGRDGDEGPQHLVTIPQPFAVGKYEVTVEQFAEFVRETRHSHESCGKANNHPVACVNWHDADTYVYWLSVKTGHEYRLLSEAEWEYAARAGTTTAYHTGRIILANQAQYSVGGAAAVGSYPANAFGLHDMHGNVWEWVEDCYHSGYKGAPTDGSAWLSGCDDDDRVLRGGSWYEIPENLRSADRGRLDGATVRNYDCGFRVARTLTP